jgi:L-2-hydroxyglutarate oxidase LhgO
MPDAHYDLIVIGGGIVGLSTAMQAVQRYLGLRILVVEKEDRVAAHQTGRNSGVIHSGLYYKPGSKKARTCVSGAAEMVEFCRTHQIPHEICGKVVVATSERELPGLEELRRRGQANGVPNLEIIGPERIKELEPHAAGIRALRVPGTGITDYAKVAEKYAALITAGGGELRLGTEVTGVVRRSSEMIVQTKKGDFETRFLINCAGLYSDRVARMSGARTDLEIIPFRGEYYELAQDRRELVHGLIYPVPDPALPFLGVHFTKRVTGGVEAGPNAVLAFGREGYRKTNLNLGDMVELFTFPGFWRMARKYWNIEIGELYRSFSKAAFTRALQKLMPEITERDLATGGAGIRAQALDRQGKLVDDFRFANQDRIVHVLNVPSPAATASLPIGRAILDMAQEAFGLSRVGGRA